MSALPPISKCSETDCFYNRGGACHAPAINVGTMGPPVSNCATYVRATALRRIALQATGVVGACHRAECRWNSDLTCTAKAIEVGRRGDHPDCLTFELAKP